MTGFVKGQTFKSLLLFLQSTLTAAELEKALATLAPEERQLIDRGILATSTFPMALVNRLTVEGARAGSRPLPQFAREAGRFAASEGVKGVYKLFARVLTVDALLTKAASMWSSMNTEGKMEVEKTGDRMAVLRLSGYGDTDPVMCMRIIGWMEQMAELAGAKHAAVTHAKCTSKGESACEWRINW